METYKNEYVPIIRMRDDGTWRMKFGPSST